MSEWIIAYIASHGYFSVIVLMFAENVFPPIPSEVILPFVGQSIAQGNLNFVLALLAATTGSVLGTFLWFLLAWFVPATLLEKFLERYGGYVAVSKQDFHKATLYFEKYEILAVFFGRMIPAIRSMISIPAGCVRMNMKIFLLYTTLGSLIWNIVLIFVGFYLLNDFVLVEKYINPVTNVIIYSLVVLYVLQVIRFIWLKNRSNL